MSTAANPSSSPVQSQNSPRIRQSKKAPAAARGVSSPPPPPNVSPPSGLVDEEPFLNSSSSTMASDSLPVKEANTEDGLATEAAEDVQLDNSENGGGSKKPAWSKPSNGAKAEVGAVMGAESWPALSESARASSKSPVTYSLKAPSVPVSQELSSISAPTTPNHTVPSRQKSMKRGVGSGSLSHNSAPANDSSSQSHAPVDASGKSGGTMGESSRDNINREGGYRGGTHGERNTFRRSNSGPLARGDGSYGRRDHERGRPDWGNNRSFGRESHGHQQRVGTRPFLRAPAPNTSYIQPPPPPIAMRPFVVYPSELAPPYLEPMFYITGPHPDQLRPHPDQLRPHPDPLRPMPMVPYFPMPDPHLPSKILNQIDYYFSNENLVKDIFLRKNMDFEGWVPVDLIAGFKKVKQLTDNIQFILDSIKTSNIVEVQGDKIRRKGDWNKWIMPSVPTPVTSPHSMNRLATHFNSVTLDEKAA